MPAFTVPRTGNSPLHITGTEIAKATSRLPAGQQRSRWHEVTIYATDSGYVVHIGYRTRYQGEYDHDWSAACVRAEIVGILRSYDPTEYVRGFPDGEHYAAKQRKLLADIRLGYEHVVSDVLTAFPDTL